MVSKVNSFSLWGVDAYLVDIEVDVSRGLPSVTIVGLADTAIKESKERVKSAIKNSGFTWPAERITISLAPCDIKKEGSGFDLAIALGVLAASQQIDVSTLTRFCLLGELSLDGSLRPTKGILPICMAMAEKGIADIIVAQQNAVEAALIKEIRVWPARTLNQVIEILNSPEVYKPFSLDITGIFQKNADYPIDFSEIKGQYAAKRAIEVSVAGGHNLLMIGPPGSGKTMLAKRIPTIMPELSLKEALEITRIHSVTGMLPQKDAILATRPFRSPHHTISDSALIGGGSIPQPGEISLASYGVLFMDELPEFSRNCLEALRQPLEDRHVAICRVQRSLVFPAFFMLVCAMNPCPCGCLGQRKANCRCSTTQIYRYRARISGPLLDRIDIHIEVPAADFQELSAQQPAESSSSIRERIDQARAIQKERLDAEGLTCNAALDHKQIRAFCSLGKEENELLKLAMKEMNLSARAYDKILKVSRTIADLAGSAQVKTEHLAEAIQYRSLDRDFFV